jgi:hypothetical protein
LWRIRLSKNRLVRLANSGEKWKGNVRGFDF